MFLFHAPITQHVQTQFQRLKTDPSESPIRTQTLALIGVQYSGILEIMLGEGGRTVAEFWQYRWKGCAVCVCVSNVSWIIPHTHDTALPVATSTNDTLPEQNALQRSLLTPRPPSTRHRLSLTNTKTPGCLESSNDTSETKEDWQTDPAAQSTLPLDKTRSRRHLPGPSSSARPLTGLVCLRVTLRCYSH
jgi:hypothetical protein